jgi:type II secretory pathway pseudopilin PulG
LLAFLSPVAKADTSDDVVKGLVSQGFYVSDGVKANNTYISKNPNLEANLRDTVNKVKGKADVRIAVISKAIIPPQQGSTQRYTQFLYDFLGSSKPTVLVVINPEVPDFYMVSDQLSSAEIQDITNQTRSVFTTGGTAAFAAQVAEKAADKISSNKTGSLITTVVIVLVVIVAVAGLAAFLLISTKNKWIKRVNGVEQLANQVSDQVVKVSDDINFLPDAARATTDAEFGTATRNFSEANTKLSELRGVSPVQLLLKGADYDRQLNLTAAQFQEAGRSLSRVGEQVRRALP